MWYSWWLIEASGLKHRLIFRSTASSCIVSSSALINRAKYGGENNASSCRARNVIFYRRERQGIYRWLAQVCVATARIDNFAESAGIDGDINDT